MGLLCQQPNRINALARTLMAQHGFCKGFWFPKNFSNCAVSRNRLSRVSYHCAIDLQTASPESLLTCDVNSNIQQKRYFRNEMSKSLISVKDLKEISSSPTPALVYGVSGLIPFVAAPIYMIMTGDFLATIVQSQVAYGACILSFIGAIRWGMALSDKDIVTPNWFNLGYSVAPSLVAWVALMLPTSFSLLTLMLGLAGAAYMDLALLGYPAWFKAMRFVLSLVAILSLWTSLMCRFLLKAKTSETNSPQQDSNETSVATADGNKE